MVVRQRPCARIHNEGGAARILRSISFLPVALLMGILSACGGGGGSGPPSGASSTTPPVVTTNSTPPAAGGSGSTARTQLASIVVNVSSVTASAATSDPAPSATISVSALAAQGSGINEVYVGLVTANSAIATVSAIVGRALDATLTFKSPGSLGAGTYHDTVTIYGCVDQACTQQVADSPLLIPVTYTVTQGQPQITSLSPTSTPAGGPGLTLQINGTGFTQQSTAAWNGTAMTTDYVSPSQLEVQLSSADVATADMAGIAVANTGAGAGLSSVTPFIVTGASPADVAAGGPQFFMTVIGEAFTSSSVVQWNGSGRATTFVSANVLRAQISATDIATAGTASVSVQTGGTAGAITASIAIDSMVPSKDAVAFQINAQHSGSISFNSLSLPTTATWSVDVGGTPSYALIADGKVFVTSQTGSGAQPEGKLFALDQATGATIWGPITLSGSLNAAYDNGLVFVSNGAQIQAYDAQSGVLKWSASPPVASSFVGVVAAGGLVFAQSDPNSTYVTAFMESNGLVAWQRSNVGSPTEPTITTDGMYFGGEGVTIDLDPATGDLIWQNAPEYSNAHNSIAVAANGVLYCPNTAEFQSYQGAELDAESGQVVGGFTAYYPPAIAAQSGYFLDGNALHGGTLSAIDLTSGTVLWTFTGDGQLMSSPVVVDQYVFVGSSSGNVYGLDTASGAVVWQQNVGASIAAGAGWGVGVPTSGLSAGDGLLVVPAGTKVTAYTLSTNP